MNAPPKPPTEPFLPYGRHAIDDEDVAAVERVLRGDWLTTGPEIGRFEDAMAAFLGVDHCVAVSSGTAALHCAAHLCGFGPGDEVLVPAITFAASANAVVYMGATPVFVDVEADTLLVDPASIRARITPLTRGIVAVDYAGQVADYEAIGAIAAEHGLRIVADRCHALGAAPAGRRHDAIADASAFSLHPVKHITAGEGGIVVVADAGKAAEARRFRNHGIATDHRERDKRQVHAYDMVELGYNYRLTDIQAALATSQLRRLPGWLERRRAIAARYDAAFRDTSLLAPLITRPDREHAHHIYLVQLALDRLDCDRDAIFTELRAAGIGVNVHYPPVHLHSFYRERYKTGPGLCPVAEAAYARMLTLPLFPGMTDGDVDRVVATLDKSCRANARCATHRL